MDTLIREGNPPAGQLASPVPQVWDPTANGGAGGWVRVYGAHNSPRAILYGPNGQPISTANRLPVDATVSGTVDVSDRADRQLGKVTLSGRNVQSQTVLPRAVRTDSTFFTVTVPAGAVACLIQYRIYSVTGTNPATLLRSFLAAPIAPNEAHAHFDRLEHDQVSSAGSQVSLRGMGVATTDLGASGQRNQAIASRARLTTHLRLNVGVSGTFGDGEGVDGEVVILWLF